MVVGKQIHDLQQDHPLQRNGSSEARASRTDSPMEGEEQFGQENLQTKHTAITKNQKDLQVEQTGKVCNPDMTKNSTHRASDAVGPELGY
jgi:hypothetical protein